MPYWRLYYHLVWATKDREQIILPELEPLLYASFRIKAVELGMCIWALNGWVDHVHLVASIPPKLAVADVVGQLKGASAYAVNRDAASAWFGWQRGYGALSLGEQRLPFTIAYVQNQKQHHEAGTLQHALELASGCDEGPIMDKAIAEPAAKDE